MHWKQTSNEEASRPRNVRNVQIKIKISLQASYGGSVAICASEADFVVVVDVVLFQV